MKGWKTWVAALPLIMFGVGEGIREVAEQTYNFAPAITKICAGLGMIGIGHKIEKGKWGR